MRDKLKTLHVNDDYFYTHDIWLLGSGDVDNINNMMINRQYILTKNTKATSGNRDYTELMLSIKEGDVIILKSATTKASVAHKLSSWKKKESAMYINAVGIVEKNNNDGKTLEVWWSRFQPNERPIWYIATEQPAVTKLSPTINLVHKDLIDFSIFGKEQDCSLYVKLNEESKSNNLAIHEIHGQYNPKAKSFLEMVNSF